MVNYTSASVDAKWVKLNTTLTLVTLNKGTDGKSGVDGKDGIATVKTVVDTINNSG